MWPIQLAFRLLISCPLIQNQNLTYWIHLFQFFSYIWCTILCYLFRMKNDKKVYILELTHKSGFVIYMLCNKRCKPSWVPKKETMYCGHEVSCANLRFV
jgi:hypothetical protein